MLALVTADAADGLDPDLPPLVDDLSARLGADQIRVVPWDDASFDWATADAAVIRSTWDYTERLAEFLAWVDHVAERTRLINDAPIVRWSTDKRYLADLAAEGIPITPTAFVAPGEDVPARAVTADVSVVKPTVGAGSAGARRCTRDEISAHAARLHAEGRTAMVQPYLTGLDEHGETALCFVAGADGDLVLSHAFRKGPILRSVEVEQVGDLFAKEDIESRVATEAELSLGRRVLETDAVRSLGAPTFARVDIAPHAGGRSDPAALVVMELELIEPSFYFESSDGAASRFGASVVAALGRSASTRVR